MLFYDESKIYVKGGDGGNGCVSFRREKFVARGGPNGGNGGNGGNIIFKVNPHLNTLSYFNTHRHFEADHGEHGKGQSKAGRSSEDLILEVPLGTQVFNIDANELLADLDKENMCYIAATGGRGGFGNEHFKSSVRQAPRFAEVGEKGEEKNLKLVLKLVADVGIIGLPNAGKSTLLSRISNARPKIAPYPFTTIIPNLGVVVLSARKSFVACDIPGLIEGSAKGKGLGHAFLRHIERTRVLVHLIDCTVPDIKSAHKQINNELKSYSKLLVKKPQIVCLTKIDLLQKKQLEQFQRLEQFQHFISAVSGEGIQELLYAVWEKLTKVKRLKRKTVKPTEEYVFRPFEEDIRNFEIEKTKDGFKITGKRIEQVVNMTNFSNEEAKARLDYIFKKIGVIRELNRLGWKEGDKIWVGGK